MKTTLSRVTLFLIAAAIVILATAKAGETQEISSTPPKGQWKAIEETSEGLPTAVIVHFSEYSTSADVKAVAVFAKQGNLKAKIESFESHGGIQVGQQISAGGKTMIIGAFWCPNFVTAELSGDTWKITIVSGSPFVEKAESGDIGFIELNVPVKGDGGIARLYMATQITYDKGQLIPKASSSQSKVLKVTSFIPSSKEK